MAIIEHHEEFQRRRYTETADEATYTTTFWVLCDSRADGLITAASSSILPIRRVSVANVRGRVLRCKELSGVAVDDTDCFFRFDAVFSSKTSEITPNEKEEDPLKRRAVVSWSFATSTEGIFIDDDGKAITSSAAEPYDPPVQVEVNDPVMVYQQNVGNFDPSLAIDYCGGFGSYNSDKFVVPVGVNGRSRTVPPGSAKAHSITADPGYENGVYFMQLRIEIWFRPLLKGGKSPWDLRVLDQGTLEWLYSPDNKSIIGRRLMRDEQGSPTNTRQLLDGFGRKLKAQVLDPDTGNVIRDGKPAVFRTNRVRRRLNYSALALKFP